MDMPTFMKNYYAELEETQIFLSLYCKNIQAAICELETRKVQLSKTVEDEVTEAKVLEDHQMSEIDILLDKAQKVYSVVEQKTKSAVKASQSNPKLKTTSSKVNSNTQKNPKSTSKSSIVNKKSVSSGKLASKKKCEVKSSLKSSAIENVSIGTNPRTNPISIENDRSGVVPSVPRIKETPFFDETFKEEYCLYHKLKRELTKSQQDQALIRVNKSVKDDFLASIKPAEDMDKIGSIVLDEVEKLVTEYHDILMDCEKLKSDSAKVIKQYHSEQQRVGIHLTKAQVKHHSKLMQWQFKIIFQQKLKTMLSSYFSSRENDLTIQHYRQLYSLLTQKSGFPSLLKN